MLRITRKTTYFLPHASALVRCCSSGLLHGCCTDMGLVGFLFLRPFYSRVESTRDAYFDDVATGSVASRGVVPQGHGRQEDRGVSRSRCRRPIASAVGLRGSQLPEQRPGERYGEQAQHLHPRTSDASAPLPTANGNGVHPLGVVAR